MAPAHGSIRRAVAQPLPSSLAPPSVRRSQPTVDNTSGQPPIGLWSNEAEPTQLHKASPGSQLARRTALASTSRRSTVPSPSHDGGTASIGPRSNSGGGTVSTRVRTMKSGSVSPRALERPSVGNRIGQRDRLTGFVGGRLLAFYVPPDSRSVSTLAGERPRVGHLPGACAISLVPANRDTARTQRRGSRCLQRF